MCFFLPFGIPLLKIVYSCPWFIFKFLSLSYRSTLLCSNCCRMTHVFIHLELALYGVKWGWGSLMAVLCVESQAWREIMPGLNYPFFSQ